MPVPSGSMMEGSAEDDHGRSNSYVQSPTHSHPYSPVNGTHPQSPYNQYSSRPSTSATMSLPSAISPRLGPPPSPKLNGPSHSQNGALYSDRETGRSTRYDPISEHREGSSNWRQSPYHTHSPKEVFNHSLAVKSINISNLTSTGTDSYGVIDPRTCLASWPISGYKVFTHSLSLSDRSTIPSSITNISCTSRASTKPTRFNSAVSYQERP